MDRCNGILVCRGPLRAPARWVLLCWFACSTAAAEPPPTPASPPAPASPPPPPPPPAGPPPHIVFILADDLGWNDLGFHGMNHIPTPNLDALAAAGVTLQRHYVAPLCTPSRAALLTGLYPIHTGMQHGVIYGAEPRGLPLRVRTLAGRLRARRYRTHLVGKWHLGSYRREHLPLNRGFESHTGFWTGKIDMFDHTNMEQGSWGHDFRRGFATAYDLFGKYATDIYTEEAVKIIKSHNASEPLFLLVSHSAVHSGNPPDPLRAPAPLRDAFPHIRDPQRQRFAGMLSSLDGSVGAVVGALGARGLLARTLLVFSTDNGGAAAGFNQNAASNYPLRGTKNTPWEGGVRGAALAFSPLFGRGGGRVAQQYMHLVDWLPTFMYLAGANHSEWSDLDGVNQWGMLSAGADSARAQVLHNIDDVTGYAAITDGPWKLVVGTTYNGSWDGWYGGPDREVPYDTTLTFRSPAAAAIASLGLMPDADTFHKLRAAATIECGAARGARGAECRPLAAPCLFHVIDDPCERDNRAGLEPAIVSRLQTALAALRRGARPPNNAALDPRGDPARWGHVYTNFRDYELPLPEPPSLCV